MQRQAVNSALGRGRPDISRTADFVRASIRPFSTTPAHRADNDESNVSAREKSRLAGKKVGELFKTALASKPTSPAGPVIDATALRSTGKASLGNAINMRSLPRTLQDRNPFTRIPNLGVEGDSPFKPAQKMGQGVPRGRRSNKDGARRGPKPWKSRGATAERDGQWAGRRRRVGSGGEGQEVNEALNRIEMEMNKGILEDFKKRIVQELKEQSGKELGEEGDLEDEFAKKFVDKHIDEYGEELTPSLVCEIHRADIEKLDPARVTKLAKSLMGDDSRSGKDDFEEYEPQRKPTTYIPNTSLETLRGYGPALATDASPLAASATVMTNLRALAWREPYDTTATPISARAMKKKLHREKVMLFSNLEEKVRVEKEQGRKVDGPDEAVREAIMEKAVRGEHDKVEWKGIEDVLGTVRVHKRLEGSYSPKDVMNFETKLIELLGPKVGAGTTSAAASKKA